MPDSFLDDRNIVVNTKKKKEKKNLDFMMLTFISMWADNK